MHDQLDGLNVGVHDRLRFPSQCFDADTATNTAVDAVRANRSLLVENVGPFRPTDVKYLRDASRKQICTI